MFIEALLILSLFTVVSSSYTEEALSDQVLEMPGLNYKPVFNQFSGYIQLAGTKKYIHYWLVEAEIADAKVTAGKSLAVIPVKTLDEALKVLQKYGGGLKQ